MRRRRQDVPGTLLVATALSIVLAGLTVVFAWPGAAALSLIAGVLSVYTASRNAAWGAILLLISVVYCVLLYILVSRSDAGFLDRIVMSRVLGFYGWVVISVLVLGAAIIAPWPVRRLRRNLGTCRTCGYNLRGNISGRCPECGTPVGY